MTILDEDWDVLTSFFPTNWRELAVEGVASITLSGRLPRQLFERW